jgi:type I restriction enzyme S subunit
MSTDSARPALHLSARYLAIVQNILRRDLPRAEVWAYGSRVKGDHHDASDLDLVARQPDDLTRPQPDLDEVAAAFSDSDLPILVQIVDWARIPAAFRDEIEAGYVVLQSADADPVAPTDDKPGPESSATKAARRDAKALRHKEAKDSNEILCDSEPLRLSPTPTLQRGSQKTDWLTCSVLELQEEGALLVEDGNHGEYRPRSDEFGEGEYAFIRAADMGDGRVLFEQAQRINDRAFSRIRKGIGRGGDVLFSHKGTVGKLAIAPLDASPFVCSPQTTFWRVLNHDRLDRRFLYHFMRSQGFTDQWMARSNETDMAAYVSLTAQRQLHVVLPKIEEQRAIAAILGALDDKIEQNRRTAHALERLARAIFRAWFVDFEPVRAKAAGATAFPSMPQPVFDALSDRFVDSEIGPVPEGWHIKPIGEVVTVKGGGTPSTKSPAYWEGGVHCWATPRDMSRLTHPILLNTERRITDVGLQQISSGLLPVGTVLMSSRAPVGYLAIAQVPTAINQGFIAMVCDGPLPSAFVLNWASASMDAIKGRASGTTFPEINKKNFRSLPVVQPSADVISAYREIAEPLLELMTASISESAQLAQLRDYLLPKLLSGAVRVNAAEQQVTESR